MSTTTKNRPGRNHIIFFTLAVCFLCATALIFRRQSHPEWAQWQKLYFQRQNIDSLTVKIVSITPTLTGKPELCLTCHLGIEEISPSHPVQAFGCVICHGGQGLTLDKESAHKTLRGRNPSDLAYAQQSCGTAPNGQACHNGAAHDWQNMVDRVQRSLQATAAGAIAHTRYTFGLQKSPFPIYGTSEVRSDSAPSPDFPKELQNIFQKIQMDSLNGHVNATEAAFAQSCLTSACHLNTPPAQKPYSYRATGCAACHYLYDEDSRYKGADAAVNDNEAGHGRVHRLTTAIPFSQCNHCHNRGIYSMKQMRFIERDDLHPDSLSFLSQQQQRAKKYYIPMAQYSKCEISLECIDCHTHNEIMGGGFIYPNKKAAVEIECRTCHGTTSAPPQERVIRSAEQQDVFIAGYNPNYEPRIGDTVAVTKKGTWLPMVHKIDGGWQQISKLDGRLFPVPLAYGSACKQDPDKQDSHSCHVCHDESK